MRRSIGLIWSMYPRVIRARRKCLFIWYGVSCLLFARFLEFHKELMYYIWSLGTALPRIPFGPDGIIRERPVPIERRERVHPCRSERGYEIHGQRLRVHCGALRFLPLSLSALLRAARRIRIRKLIPKPLRVFLSPRTLD